MGGRSPISSGVKGPNTTRPSTSPSQRMGSTRYLSPVKQGTAIIPCSLVPGGAWGARAFWVVASGPSFTRATVWVQQRFPSGNEKT